MKKLICLISFIIIWTNSEAQQIGAYYNVTLSKITFNSDFYRAKSIGMEYHFRTDKLVNFSLIGAYEKKGYNITTSLGNLNRVRFEYYTLKGLTRIGNDNFDAQIGIYGGYLHYVEEWYNTTWNTDEDYYGKIDAGLSAILSQRLFSIGPFSYYLKGEVNYGIFSIQDSELIDFRYGHRNINLGLGLAVRWNYKD